MNISKYDDLELTNIEDLEEIETLLLVIINKEHFSQAVGTYPIINKLNTLI